MTEKKSTLSPREMETLALTWQCFTTEPKVDTDKLAALTGVRDHRPHPLAANAPAATHPPQTHPPRPHQAILSAPQAPTHPAIPTNKNTPPQYTPSSAKFTLGVIKRKLKTMADGTAAANANANANTTGAKVVKRKAAPKKKAAKDVDGEVDHKRVKKVRKTELESDDGDDAMMGVVVKEEVRDEEEV
ncbi:hypothetical protein B5807_10758 [Epicoccum nigrum]|uniref:Uncharacterized protein n=1 Tax=Epicoccum nigrum TaxID=105696 RepID=A0A1Y2LKW9_EPING|nr:hypothetical protein B5807_10758 [Epicoccum nigrum]